jgi:hypothetical protein
VALWSVCFVILFLLVCLGLALVCLGLAVIVLTCG